jgi:hypothetical protein
MDVGAGRIAELERGEADAVEGDIDGGRGAIERLADHQNRFAVRIAAQAEEGDVRGERDVARDLLPGELKVVNAEPHVFAAATEGIGMCGIVIDG